MELKCPRKECEHTWNYKGQGQWYTSCPKCKTSVKIMKGKRLFKENPKANPVVECRK